MLAQHIVAPIPSLTSVNPALSPAVQTVLEKALAKDPAARYQAAADLATGLKTALATTVVEPPAAGGAGAPAAGMSQAEPAPQTARPELPTCGPLAPAHGLDPAYGFAPQFPPYPGPSWAPRPPDGAAHGLRRHRGLLVAGGLVVVIAAILAGVLSTRTAKSTTTTTGTLPLASSVSSILSSVATAPFMTSGSSLALTTSTAGSSSSTLVTDVSPQTAGLRAEAGALMMAGKFNEAIAKYTEALQINPNDAAARIGLGIAYYHQPKSPQLGAQHLEAAVALDPGNVQAWAYLGACRYLATHMSDGQDYTSAEEACNKALELDPNSALAHAFLGQIYTATKRPDEALAEASRAISLAPSEPEVLVAMGDVKAEGNEWEAAVPYYTRAVTLASNYPDYVLYLASALRETEQYDASLEYCRNALQLDEGYEYAAYRGIGRTLWDKGDLEGAKTNLQKAISLDDTDAMAHWALGGVYYDQGRLRDRVAGTGARSCAPAEQRGHARVAGCLLQGSRAVGQGQGGAGEIGEARSEPNGGADHAEGADGRGPLTRERAEG